MVEIKIGDTLYRFDVNRRYYRKDASGRATGGPIYREYFEGLEVAGETPRCWLVGEGFRQTKVNKRTMRSSGGRSGFGFQWFTKASMEDDIWRNDHRRYIVAMIERCDGETLRKIAALVGYDSTKADAA